MRQDLNAIVARIADQHPQPAPRRRRRPIAPATKARMIAVLKERNYLTTIYAPDLMLITYMKNSRRTPVVCDECNGTGIDGSPSYPEPCPVCNGKRYILARPAATGSTTEV